MRTIIDLPEEQIQALQVLGEQEQKSRAALIREAVGKLLAEQLHKTQDREKARLAAIDAVFGMWEDWNVDGVEYQRALRREWDEREARIWAPYRKEHDQ